MKVLLSIFLLMSLVACSGSKSENSAEGAEAGTELADNEEFSEDFAEDNSSEEEIAEDSDAISDEADAESTDDVASDDSQAAEQSTEMAEAQTTETDEMSTSSEEGWHTVQKHETLMIIAFKIYGDYEKWRQLARWNAGKLGPNHTVSQGMKLKFEAPAQSFSWNPEGNPYLIKVGDTLGTISKDTYGTQGYWKNIWTNNKPLIKDPNRIFAGFTIYTPLLEGRDVANQDI